MGALAPRASRQHLAQDRPVTPEPPRLTRRALLRSAGGAATAILVAACSDPTPSSEPATPGRSNAPAATGATPSVRPASPSEEAAPSPSPAVVSASPGPDLRTRIAQMLLVGFRGLTVATAAETVADVRQRGLGGVVLFDYDTPTGTYGRNIASPAQLKALVAGLRAAASIPLLVAVDEEGGQVDRLAARYGFPPTVSEAALGARDDAAYTRRRARAIGATLAGVGIDLDLAPVVDVNINPKNPIIGALGRSFSPDPAVVTSQGLAYLAGLHDAGVAGTLKHFPGHGSSTGDTHLGWVDVTRTWRAMELDPFRAIIAARAADAVLVAHVFDAKLDPVYPASLSERVIGGILREQLGFGGVVISDDLQMGALRSRFDDATIVERAILAGTDILTIANEQVYEPHIVATTIETVVAAVAAGRISEARIDASWRRIEALKAGRAHG